MPSGGLGLDEDVAVPAVSLPAATVQGLISQLRRGAPATVSIGAVEIQPNGDRGQVAAFSSSGLAFDGRVKPDIVAPGVALATGDPGANADGSPKYATVNGSSAAAESAAGEPHLVPQIQRRQKEAVFQSLIVCTA